MVEYCLCILDSRDERELSRNEKKNNFCGVWYCKKAGSWKNLMVILNEQNEFIKEVRFKDFFSSQEKEWIMPLYEEDFDRCNDSSVGDSK